MITTEQFLEIAQRLNKNRPAPTVAPKQQAEREVGKGGLQEQIQQYCVKQWPRWKIIQARPDQKSTIAKGAQDMTIFASRGRIFCVETKAKGGKPSADQLAWAKEMEMIDHKVHFVWSFEEFMQIVETAKP
jgi:hypothetical protein